MGVGGRAEAQGESEERRPGHEFIAAAVASAARGPGHLATRRLLLLPGWKEPSYKSPLAKTEPKLRVGLQIPSLDEARRKPRRTILWRQRSSRYPYRRRRPRKTEFTRNLGRRRASRPTRSRRNGGPRRKPRRRRFPVVPAGPRIVDIEPDYKPGPRTAARRRVHARRSDVQLPCSPAEDAAAEEVVHTPPPAPPSPDDTSARSWAVEGGGPGAPRARAARFGVAGDQPAVGRVIATRRRLGRASASSASATGGRC